MTQWKRGVFVRPSNKRLTFLIIYCWMQQKMKFQKNRQIYIEWSYIRANRCRRRLIPCSIDAETSFCRWMRFSCKHLKAIGALATFSITRKCRSNWNCDSHVIIHFDEPLSRITKPIALDKRAIKRRIAQSIQQFIASTRVKTAGWSMRTRLAIAMRVCTLKR